jgi:hypothetical protein
MWVSYHDLSSKRLDRLNRSDATDWSTRDEVGFLHGLGQHRDPEHRRETRTRRELLQLYLDSVGQRTEWGDIEKVEVVKVAEELLAREEEKR